MAVTKISSYDTGYVTGNLSLYPEAIDSRYQLYEAKNNAETKLSQSLTYTAKFILVENNDSFPSTGIIRIGPPPGQSGAAEMIYYDSKSQGIFKNLIRGFAGSRQNPWPVGSYVTSAVFAEHHNSIKDAIINIETNVGVETNPLSTSLNGILKTQENRFLAPRPVFRSYPTIALPGKKIRFQNFSSGPIIRYLWDFGDGTTSIEKSPSHTYYKEGIFSIKLNIITESGAQGIAEKKNYITISNDAALPFFYILPKTGISMQTAISLGDSNLATKFNFVDQADGDIIQRYWVFDGVGYQNGVLVPSQTITEVDPNIHFTSYTYDKPGKYTPSLLIVYENQKVKRSVLADSIVVE
jgi:PKD repeat protein